MESILEVWNKQEADFLRHLADGLPLSEAAGACDLSERDAARMLEALADLFEREGNPVRAEGEAER